MEECYHWRLVIGDKWCRKDRINEVIVRMIYLIFGVGDSNIFDCMKFILSSEKSRNDNIVIFDNTYALGTYNHWCDVINYIEDVIHTEAKDLSFSYVALFNRLGSRPNINVINYGMHIPLDITMGEAEFY